jgi:hypothetical protein
MPKLSQEKSRQYRIERQNKVENYKECETGIGCWLICLIKL